MKYSLWHCGALIGDAHMRKSPGSPRQLYGPLRPTAYGRTLLPTLTGVLSAAVALKHELSARGMSEESLPGADDVERFLDSSPAGQRMMDVGRIISDLELRDDAGVPVTFQSIGFLDVASLAQQFGSRPAPAMRPPTPSQSPRVLVSATLAPRQPSGTPTRRLEVT